jgi:hypothetical protein
MDAGHPGPHPGEASAELECNLGCAYGPVFRNDFGRGEGLAPEGMALVSTSVGAEARLLVLGSARTSVGVAGDSDSV